MNTKELYDYLPYLPIADLDDSCIATKRGDITFGWRLLLPTAYTVTEAGYDSILHSFSQAYSLLPDYTIIHKQDIFRYDIYQPQERGEYLMNCYEKHFKGRQYLNGYCYIFITFSSKSIIEQKTPSSGFFRMLSSKAPKREDIEHYATIASQFEAVLGNNSLLTLIPLKARDFIYMDENGMDRGLIPDYLRFYSNNLNIDYPIEFNPSYISSGDTIAKAWFIEDSNAYPSMVNSVSRIKSMSASTDIFLSGGSPIGYQLKTPHIVNRYILILPHKVIEKELDMKRRIMTSFSLYSASCRINSEELSSYLEINARESLKTIKCFTDVIAWGNASQMPDITNRIITAFTDLDITVCEERRVMPVLHYAGLPGAAGELGYDNYMTSEIGGFISHGLWDGYDSGIKGGAFKVCDRSRMIPLTIDTQSVARDSGLISGLNMLVVGPTGSGKSFTTNHLVNNFYAAGQHGFVIDVGDSYQGLFGVINEQSQGKDGIYNTYSTENPLSFNPFRGRQHWNEMDSEGENASSGFAYIISLIETMYTPQNGWVQQNTSILEHFILEFIAFWDNGYDKTFADLLKEAFVNSSRQRAEKHKKGFDEKATLKGFINPLDEIFCPEREPVFDDFYKYVTLVVSPLMKDESYKIDNSVVRTDMFDIDAFGVAISKYRKNGIYGFLLNAEKETDIFSSRLTCFEVDKIKDNKDLFPLWLLSIIHLFEDKMRTLSCPKFIVIEEAWSAIAIPTMARFLVWLWRTARKFRTSAIVVTQSIHDLTGSDIIKDAIINNTSTKIILDQSADLQKFSQSAKVISLNEQDTAQVLSINKNLNANYRYKEAFFAIGDHYSNVFGIEVSPEQALVYESDKTKKKELFDKASEYGSFIRAIEEIVSKNRK